MHRRTFMLKLANGTVLAGLAACTSGGGLAIPPVPIQVQLPANVSTFLGEVNDIIMKIDSLGTSVSQEVQNLEGQAKTLVGQISSGGSASTLGATLLGVLGDIAPLLPSPYNLIASAIMTVLPSLASLIGGSAPAMAPAFRGRLVQMDVNRAWEIIRSR